MSGDNTPADSPGRGPEEQAGAGQPDSADGAAGAASQPESPEARAEEAGRMRDRVRQREESDGERAPGAQRTDGEPRATRPAGPPSGRPPEGGRTIASGSAGTRAGGGAAHGDSVPEQGAADGSGQSTQGSQGGAYRGPEQAPRSHPVITGTAAARLLGKDKGEPVTAPGPQDQGRTDKPAEPGRRGTGIDAPTSHIDRSNVPEERMPDLGAVDHATQGVASAPVKEHEQHPQPRVTVGARRSRGPLRAAMQLRSIDPWSTLKVSFLLSVAMFLVWMVAVAIIYIVLDGMGVWDRLNTGLSDIVSDQNDTSTLIGPGQVFGVAAILGMINIVLFTALSTLGAFIYNLSSDMVGGVEVTLADRD